MIDIVDYRPTWPDEFRSIGRQLRDALGDLAPSIHHIGSTAVPGLAAKDVIDVQVTVAALADDLIEVMATAGFAHVPHITADHLPPGARLPPIELTKLLFNGTGRRSNVHVRQRGRFNQRYPLLCRDYLRARPSAAAAYAEVKRQLARHVGPDPGKYYDVKDPVFDILMAGADDWATATCWTEPPTDA